MPNRITSANGEPTISDRTSLAWSASPEELPRTFGRFTLRERLGAGGFGVVYRADDTALGRPVAVKIPHRDGMGASARQRMLREGAAAAGLHHPNIVQVHQAGEFAGVAYLVSEYCPGMTLRKWLKDNEPSPRFAARIVLSLALAVDHAHRKGVIHRDIKPANILLDDRTPEPGLPFTPKLTDFGAAKVEADEATRTETGLLIGTAAYMAPEQATGAPKISSACDLYALGVVLFELASGRPPIIGDDNLDTLRRVSRGETPPLRELSPDAPRDLDAICRKCLEVSPEARYGDAASLAADLQRFLRHEPTRARPLSPIGWLQRWVRRRPGALAALEGTAVIVLIAVVVVASWLHSANRQTRRLEAMLEEQDRIFRRDSLENYTNEMADAERALRAGDVRNVQLLLDGHRPELGRPDWRGFEWYFLGRAIRPPSTTLLGVGSPIYTVKIHPNGQHIACSGADGVIRFVERATGDVVWRADSEQREVNELCFSPDGETLASAGDDGSIAMWRVSDGAPRFRFAAHQGLAFGARFTPDGQRLVSCGSEGDVRIWEANTGRESPVQLDCRSKRRTEAIAISPDGRSIVSVGEWPSALLHDARTGETIRRIESYQQFATAAFSPDGRYIAFGATTGVWSVKILDLKTGEWVLDRKHVDGVTHVAFSADGRSYATTDKAGVARVWPFDLEQTASQAPVRAWSADANRTHAIVFEPEGSVLTVGAEGALRRWDFSAGRLRLETPREQWASRDSDKITDAAFTSDDVLLLGADSDVLCLVPEGDTMQPLALGGKRWSNVAVARQECFAGVYGEGQGGSVVQWPVGRRDQRRVVWRSECKTVIQSINASSDGRWLAISYHDLSLAEKRVELLNLATGVTHAYRASAGSKPQFSKDGRWLAFSRGPDIQLVDLSDDALALSRHKHMHRDSIVDIAISPNGAWLASCDEGREIRIWRFPDMKSHAQIIGHRATVTDLAFHPDPNAETLLSSSLDGTLMAWQVRAARALIAIHRGGPITRFSISPSGDRLALIEKEGTVVRYRLGD